MKVKLPITILSSLGFGALCIIPVVTGQNGYIAGFVFLPILLLIAVICLVLFIIAFAFFVHNRMSGLYFLLALFLVPAGFFGAAMVAKTLELGAYREDPMTPFPPEVSNIVLLKKDIRNDEINQFWNEVLGDITPDGKGNTSLPGIQEVVRLEAKNGHEAISFSFFSNASDEQREYAYSRVRASPLVYQLLENVQSKDYMPAPEPEPTDNRPRKKFEKLTAPVR